ncbi:MAG: 1,4-alpha-glucan branching protein GlgB [Armatimonadetes bacterium]|nr:1,4-alpha-glucan branching protein GlgB [Armatimonadota bacterium]MDW8120721.1 1,4-alpha-glucan branching protein GlgB [Armatimonadota bacterium]
METISRDVVDAICDGYCSDPFAYLGIHPISHGSDRVGIVIRVFNPYWQKVWIIPEDQPTARWEMEKRDPRGFFEWMSFDRTSPFSYQLYVSDQDGRETVCEDPYRFPSVLRDEDIYLFGKGDHRRLWEFLGSHIREIDGKKGVLFVVWAPNALRVSVVGDFNRWDGRVHPMRLHPSVGLWELFLPGLDAGVIYKYEIRSQQKGFQEMKADPVGFHFEKRPRTAGYVIREKDYRWGDGEWMSQRHQRQRLNKPIAIYEVHLGSWKRVPEEGHRWLTYEELAAQLPEYVAEMGFTHIELLPVMEHPLDESWGYQVTGYFAPTSRYGEPNGLRWLIDRCHQLGIGVLLDWVPAHFPKDMHGLVFFDGTNLYEYADWRGDHPDWGTKVFNFASPFVRNFLIASALFWLEEFHADGLRIDAVASLLYLDYSRKEGEWQPNQFGGKEHLEAIDFLRQLNQIVHERFPDTLMIAEESTAWPLVTRPPYIGGLGFDFKWNMGWMHDMLLYMSKDPIYRQYHHNNLTFSLWYAFSENFILPLSHDEVVHGKGSLLGKMPGDLWQKFANLRALYAYMYAHPGKKLLFMGSEIGQWREWDYASSLDWHLLQWESHQGIQKLIRDLNHLYKSEPALYEWDCDARGFEWVDFSDAAASVVSFLRWAADWRDCVLVVANFTPVVRYKYRIGVPCTGVWMEILNTDALHYNGSGVTNPPIAAEPIPWAGRPCSLSLTLPPLAVIFLKKMSD